MVSSRWKSLAALVLASAGLGGFAAFAEEQAAETEQPIEVRARWVAQDGEDVPVKAAVQVVEEASPYWIGVQLEPPTDILKAHLNLEGGMVTVHVFEDSPAAKAGLKANDIILKAGDGYVKEPGDLLKSVADAEGNELTLVLIRGGKEQTLKVVPAKRPLEVYPAVKETEAAEKEVVQKLEVVLNSYKRRSAAVAGETPAVDYVRLRPGVVVAWEGHHGLPKDVSVTITKEGASPAKIVVKKDGKEYETTEDKLNQLPEELRGYVQLVRGDDETAIVYHARKAVPQATLPLTTKQRAITPYKADTVPTPLLPHAATEAAKVYRYAEFKHAAGDVDSKLDQILKLISQKEDSSVSELRKEVRQLRKELEELRQGKK